MKSVDINLDDYLLVWTEEALEPTVVLKLFFRTLCLHAAQANKFHVVHSNKVSDFSALLIEHWKSQLLKMF